jgi:hypothetical protein
MAQAADPLACAAHPATIETLPHVSPGFSASKIRLVKGNGVVDLRKATNALDRLENIGGHTA